MKISDALINKFIEYKPLDKTTINDNLIGQVVFRIDRGYGEYGIVTGFNDKVVFTHFANNRAPLMINPCDLYIPNVKPK